jgi:hypothetical protein
MYWFKLWNVAQGFHSFIQFLSLKVCFTCFIPSNAFVGFRYVPFIVQMVIPGIRLWFFDKAMVDAGHYHLS